MQGDRRRRDPCGQASVQRAVMTLALSMYPHWSTVRELKREIDCGAAVTSAIRMLIEVGLLERAETPKKRTSVRPTEAAAFLERLRLP
jgi:hypothetical protein